MLLLPPPPKSLDYTAVAPGPADNIYGNHSSQTTYPWMCPYDSPTLPCVLCSRRAEQASYIEIAISEQVLGASISGSLAPSNDLRSQCHLSVCTLLLDARDTIGEQEDLSSFKQAFLEEAVSAESCHSFSHCLSLSWAAPMVTLNLLGSCPI